MNGVPNVFQRSESLPYESEYKACFIESRCRYYYFEYRIESFEPQRVWGVAAVGLGQSESARKFKLRQQVIITCQVYNQWDYSRTISALRNTLINNHKKDGH